MSGPTPIALGGFAFEALGFGMGELTRDLQTPWSELETAMRFDALHWTGPKSDSVTIKGVLFPEEFGGEESLAGIAAAAKSGMPMMLVTGAGDIGGLFVVTSVSQDWSYIDANGAPRRDAYAIQMKRYEDGLGLAALMELF